MKLCLKTSFTFTFIVFFKKKIVIKLFHFLKDNSLCVCVCVHPRVSVSVCVCAFTLTCHIGANFQTLASSEFCIMERMGGETAFYILKGNEITVLYNAVFNR